MLGLSLLLAVATALGQAPPVYVTELGRRVLARTDQLVEAEVVHLHAAFRGVSTARLRVMKRLHGFDRSQEIVLLFIEDYQAPDAFTATLERSAVRYERRRKAGLAKYLKDVSRLKVPRAEDEITNRPTVKRSREEAPRTPTPGRGVGVRLARGEKGLFFLRRREASYAMVGYVPARDPLYQAKRGRLENVLRLEAIPALDVRAGNAKRFYLAGLRSDDPWQRGNSAREVRGLALRFPDLFTAQDAKVLARRLYEETEPPIQASLERALRAVDPERARTYALAEERRARERHAQALQEERRVLEATRLPEVRAADLVRLAQRYGRAATGILTDFLTDPQPLVRERAAQALAELGGPSALAPLRRALARERDRDAATAMIYACGVKGDVEAIPLLTQRLRDPALARTAVHALARIGGPAARTALEEHRRRADAATKDLIESLLREEFAG
ncbi:MAG: HEAT repeat domain-containing protein [Planctomycetota bacterium]